MATEDWELVHKGFWGRKDDSLKHIHVAASKDVTKGHLVKTPYIFWAAVYSGDPFLVRGFNTKAKAEAFAERYMRSH